MAHVPLVCYTYTCIMSIFAKIRQKASVRKSIDNNFTCIERVAGLQFQAKDYSNFSSFRPNKRQSFML